MEESRILHYIKGLERKIHDDHQYLKETVEELRDLCRVITPDKNIPQGIVVDIKELHKEIQSRFKEIRGIQQLVQGKYRQFYRRDPLLDKNLLELGFVTKTTFSRFEENLKLYVERQKAREREKVARTSQREMLLQWFKSREKQMLLLRKMRTLKELDYAPKPGGGPDERRSLEGVRSLTLFLVQGDGPSLDSLQSQMHLREHDLIERHDEGQLRGLLTHLREVDPSEIESLFHLFFEKKGFSTLKCLLVPIQPKKEIDPEIMDLVAEVLREMKEGEVRTLSS